MDTRLARILIRVAILAAATAAHLAAQDSARTQGELPGERVARSPSAGHAFFRVRPEDGEHVDAHDAAELDRRVSLTLIGVPLGAAIEAIAARAGLDVTYATESAPLGARVSMKADDVTVAAALAWVLGDAPLDVLVGDGGRLTLVSRASATDADSSGVISGSLVDQDTGEPVPYATVTLVGTDRSRFVDASGHFRLARLTPRRYALRARQIGYAPLDTTVDVGPAPAIATVTLRMHCAAVLLKLVRVIGRRPKGCVATGPPNPAADPELAALFLLVRENVDRYRLLLEEYPFQYVREERRDLLNGGRTRLLSLDTVAYDSRAQHQYRAGAVVYTEGKRRYMYLPTFADLGDTAFLAAHCFSMGVFQHSRRGSTFRLDFKPADRLHTPDVAGSVYLDAQRFVVRRAEFHLTRSQDAHPPVMDLSVTATFRDFVPLVPILDSVEGHQTVAVVGHDLAGIEREIPGDVQYVDENDHVVAATFERRFPGDQVEALRSVSVDSTLRLNGRVVGADGAPIRGARVRGFASLNIVATDDSGRFVYFGAPPADQILEVRHAGYRPRRILVSMRSAATEMQITLTRDSVLAAAAIPDSEADVVIPRAHSVFGSDASCKLPPARDTVQLPLYASLDGHRPPMASDTAWSRFIARTLVAIRRSFALPSDLPIPVFSAQPGQSDSASVDDPPRRRASVAPVFASAVVFEIDTLGSAASLRVAASSLSGPVDTSVLATVERAQANGALPALPRGWAVDGEAQLHLMVSSGTPPSDAVAGMIGVAAVPEWSLDRAATLDSVDRPVLNARKRCTEIMWDAPKPSHCLDALADDSATLARDTATFTGVIDTRGRVVPQSVRSLRDNTGWLTKRVVEVLPQYKFAPARIGSCAVSELTRLTFHLPLDQE